MKNKLLLILTLCLNLQFTASLGASEDQKVPNQIQEIQVTIPEPEQSYWRIYTPQTVQDLGDYAASWIPQSIRDRVNSLSRYQKMGLLSTLIASLAFYYNKDDIMAFVNNTFERSSFIHEAKSKLESWTRDETIDPIARYYLSETLAKTDNKELERTLGELFDSKDMSSNQARLNFLFEKFFGLEKFPGTSN